MPRGLEVPGASAGFEPADRVECFGTSLSWGVRGDVFGGSDVRLSGGLAGLGARRDEADDVWGAVGDDLSPFKQAGLMALPEISDFVTGAGSASGILGLWVRWLILKNERVEGDLKEERNRSNELQEKAIEAIILNKAFLESHQAEISSLGGIITAEAASIRKSLQSLEDEITQK